MINLFIITTPFQLLSTYEAIHSFKLTNNVLVIIENSNPNNKKQLDLMIEKNHFSQIIQFGFNKKSKLFESIKLIKQLKKQTFNYLFLGDLGSIHKIFASNLKSNSLFLLDDGTATIIRYSQFKEHKNIFKKSFRQLRYNLFGLKTSTRQKINIFTMFDNLRSLEKCEVHNHSFAYLRSKYDLLTKPISNEVYILGETFINDKITSKDQYLEYIQSIIKRYSNHKIYYLLHRNEDKKDLALFKDQIELIESKIPGEIYFMTLASQPKVIISSFTTLLFTLNKLFTNIDIVSYRLTQNKKYDDIFDLLRINGINVISNNNIEV